MKGVKTGMITEICRHINNSFQTEVHSGSFKIENGCIDAGFLSNGDYYLIRGSRRNDGVHLHPSKKLADETFAGELIIMSPPMDFLKLVSEIESYEAKNSETPYLRESFGGYSYTRLTENGRAVSWQKVFKDRLNAYRKMC